MSRSRLIASYFISLAVLWLITSIAAGVWTRSVFEGVVLATAAPIVPPFYGVAVLVADGEHFSLVDPEFVLAATGLTPFLVLIASVITAFCKRAQKRWIVVSHALLVVYWVAGAWVTCRLEYAISHMP